jgi:hypothetical protein
MSFPGNGSLGLGGSLGGIGTSLPLRTALSFGGGRTTLGGAFSTFFINYLEIPKETDTTFPDNLGAS